MAFSTPMADATWTSTYSSISMTTNSDTRTTT